MDANAIQIQALITFVTGGGFRGRCPRLLNKSPAGTSAQAVLEFFRSL